MSTALECDVLIVGCGIAGATTALQLADAGLSIIVITKNETPEESNTYYAQGGIIYRDKNSDSSSLRKDIVAAGDGICNDEVVDFVIENGPPLVKKILIDRLKVPFTKSPTGELALIKEGGHSKKRIIHKDDATGLSIEKSIIELIRQHKNIRLLKNCAAVDLLTPGHHSKNKKMVYKPPQCCGAYVFDAESSRILRIFSRHTVLATGGLGQIYLRSTNPHWAVGDGLAMAYRAGARVINLEYVQFHPTSFYKVHAPNFLVSEAVRGGGARFVNENGVPFMDKYSPEWKDLAPRDLIARSVHYEMLETRKENVYLDLKSYIPKDKIKSLYPNIYVQCLKYGVNISEDLVPVVPAAHYSCGGIWTDIHGSTSLAGLYAVGEVSCTGLHGANRLASTSLLEGLVFADAVAKDILEKQTLDRRNKIENLEFHYHDIPPWKDTGHFLPDAALIHQDFSSIKHIMWNYVGLSRTRHRLDRALRELRHLEFEIERFYKLSKLSLPLISLRNAVRSAILVTLAASANKESLGCHSYVNS